MTTGMGLSVSGIDLRHTPDDRWVCFKVNPSPAFVYYTAATGQPIGGAIARLLVSADAAHVASSSRGRGRRRAPAARAARELSKQSVGRRRTMRCSPAKW